MIARAVVRDKFDTTESARLFSLTFLVLEAVGYQAKEGAVNSPQAIHNLELAYLIGPVVFVMLGGACMIGYGLDAKRHADIRRQLDERDALYTETVTVETLATENLTLETVTVERTIAVPPQAGR